MVHYNPHIPPQTAFSRSPLDLIKEIVSIQKANKHAAESETDDAEMPTYRPLSDYAEKASKQYYNSMEAVNKKDWRKFIAETIFTEDFLVKIDEYARIAFPVSFALFNALYFGTYIS